MNGKNVPGLAFLPGVCLLLAGCGDAHPSARLAGQVTLDGTPLAAGVVVVVTENGATAATGSIANGSYLVEKAPPGPVKLYLIILPLPADLNAPPLTGPGPPRSPRPTPRDKPLRPGMLDISDDMRKALEIANKVPKAYRDEKTTPLRHILDKGDNTFDLNLTITVGGPAPGFPLRPPRPSR